MVRPTHGGKDYDRAAFSAYLEGLLENHNESMREASLKAGLDHGALCRFITKHQRPTRESCIAIADHFRLNPNEVLTRAGYDPMHFFDRSLIDPGALPPEVMALAEHLSHIEPLSRRRQLCQTIREMLELAAPGAANNRGSGNKPTKGSRNS
jgi:hypothetical protein